MIRADTVGKAPTRIGTPLVAAALRDRIDALPQRRDRHAGMAQEDLAGTGDPDAAAVALEHRDAQRLLQFADRLGHRRLADIAASPAALTTLFCRATSRKVCRWRNLTRLSIMDLITLELRKCHKISFY